MLIFLQLLSWYKLTLIFFFFIMNNEKYIHKLTLTIINAVKINDTKMHKSKWNANVKCYSIFFPTFKGIVQPNISIFTHPHVVPNL